MRKMENPVVLAEQAASEIIPIYGSRLVSVILYGSAAGGDFDPGRSDINLLIVLKELGFEGVCKLSGLWKRLKGKGFGLPIFMDPGYMKRALDSYPIEFLDMKGCYKVIVGEDMLANIEIDREHIRLQVERELRGKLLHLLSNSVVIGNKSRRLRELMEVSLKDFGAVFRALLFLKEEKVERDRKRLWGLVEKAYGLDTEPFTGALRIIEVGKKQEVAAVFPGYVKGVQSIIAKIDLKLHGDLINSQEVA